MSETSENKSTNPWTVRKSVNEALRARDMADLDEEEELEEEEAQELQAGMQVDVFDFCHQLAEKGDVVAYSIYKNSSFVAKKAHPYSWEQLQKELGEGHYRVQAKSEITKRILKQQTSFVAAPEEKSSTAQSVGEAIRSALPPKENPFDEMAKMATLLKSLAPPPAEDKTGPVMLQVMQTMMQIQQTSQKDTLTLIMEMQKANREMIEKMETGQRATLEKLEAKLSGGEKKDRFDPLQLLSLVQSAESRGMKNYMLIEELAEKKAARLGGKGDDDDKDESMTDKLIKTALPAISAAMANRQAPAPAQPPRASVRPVANLPRRPGPAAPIPVKVAPQSAAPAPAQVPAQVQPNKPIDVQVLPASTPKGPQISKALPGKQILLDAIMPNLGAKLLESSLVSEDLAKVRAIREQAAQETKAIVNRLGVPVSHLLHSVKENDMIEIAKGVGLPDEAHPWLKEFYAHLSTIATSEASSGRK